MLAFHHNNYSFEDRVSLNKVSFIKQLEVNDDEQFQLLLKQTRIVELSQGETLLEEGSCDPEFFALLSGKLDVINADNVVGHISAGQLIGFFSLINNEQRSATLIASGVNGARVVGINYRMFGALDDFCFFSLSTKILLYRDILKFTRWKLDEHVRLNQNPTISNELDKDEVYLGEKNSLEELSFYHERIQTLSSLFSQMNDSDK